MDDLKKCRERSLYLLESSDMSEKRLREKLNFSPDIVEETIKFLKEYHFLDDYSYCKRLLNGMLDKYSLKDAENRLFLKGFSEEIINQCISEESDIIKEKERNAALKFSLKKSGRRIFSGDLSEYEYSESEYKTRDKEDLKERDFQEKDFREKVKLYQALRRKGFSADAIEYVMKTLFHETF